MKTLFLQGEEGKQGREVTVRCRNKWVSNMEERQERNKDIKGIPGRKN
jgi:hypothetical protein